MKALEASDMNRRDFAAFVREEVTRVLQKASLCKGDRSVAGSYIYGDFTICAKDDHEKQFSFDKPWGSPAKSGEISTAFSEMNGERRPMVEVTVCNSSGMQIVSWSSEEGINIYEHLGKCFSYPYTVICWNSDGFISVATVWIGQDIYINYTRNLDGTYETTDENGNLPAASLLEKHGLPKKLEEAKYLTSLPIKDFMEINAEETAESIIGQLPLEELLEAVQNPQLFDGKM